MTLTYTNSEIMIEGVLFKPFFKQQGIAYADKVKKQLGKTFQSFEEEAKNINWL